MPKLAGIARNAHEVLVQAVLTHAMPPNNVSEMTMDERHVLRDWMMKAQESASTAPAPTIQGAAGKQG